MESTAYEATNPDPDNITARINIFVTTNIWLFKTKMNCVISIPEINKKTFIKTNKIRKEISPKKALFKSEGLNSICEEMLTEI